MSDKISKDVAEAEFNRFVDAMGLELDVEDLDDDDRSNINTHRNRLIRAIQSGSLVVNEDGECVFTPQVSEDTAPLVFREPAGAALMAMDRRKSGEDVAKLYATMANMARCPAQRFSKMKFRDLRICMSITTLFLG